MIEPTASELDQQALAHELELFRKALELPTVGVQQVGDTELLRSLVRRYPEQARAYLAEIGRAS